MQYLFERLFYLIEIYADGEQKAFAKQISCAHSTFHSYLKQDAENKVKISFLLNILETFPNVNRDWLFFGEGEALQNKDVKEVSLTSSIRKTEKKNRATVSFQERPTYPDDVLERIAILTGIRATSALQLQKVFGADFKEIKPWLSKYMRARFLRDEWRANGGGQNNDHDGYDDYDDYGDYDIPPAFPEIPEEWLYFFWTNFGPNPSWVQYGERPFGGASLLTEQPRTQAKPSQEKSEQEKTSAKQDNLLVERIERLERDHATLKDNVNVVTHADTNLSVSCVTVEENIN